jgi:hypothetical protein
LIISDKRGIGIDLAVLQLGSSIDLLSLEDGLRARIHHRGCQYVGGFVPIQDHFHQRVFLAKFDKM